MSVHRSVLDRWQDFNHNERIFRRRARVLRTIFANSPPTCAARWITCVGLYFSNIAAVDAGSHKSASYAWKRHRSVSHFSRPSPRRSLVHVFERRDARSSRRTSRTLDEANIHSSFSGRSPAMTSRMALPTRPLPPVTSTTFFVIATDLDARARVR